MDQKVFMSGFTKAKDWKKDAQSVLSNIRTAFGGKSCDLAVFFVSEPYKNFEAEAFVKLVGEILAPKTLLGCNSSGVIANEKEIEMEPGVSWIAMHLPDVKLSSFYISPSQLEELKDGNSLIEFLDVYPTDRPKFLCLADPATCEITKLLGDFNEAYKGMPVVGGLASGGVVGIENWLCLNGTIYTEGAVGVALVGNVEFDVIVSQGCRPIGQPYVITKVEGNVLYELAGKQTLEIVKEVLDQLNSKDKNLAQHSLFVGLAMHEKQAAFKRGDFLIRNIVGFDPDAGSLMIGALPKVGQTLQFQLRDADTSEEDLKLMLDRLKEEPAVSPQGGILVSCCGRGKGLYGKPDHDIRMIQSAKGPLPLAGFFANGEIGPIGQKNYIHGYTSSLVILR